MDGHGPRNQTGIARNTSRKDGIRAGAVSGPWRSQPVADDRGHSGHGTEHGPIEAAHGTHDYGEPIRDHAPEVVRRPRAERGRTGLGIAIAFVVATLLAGAAWWLTGTERWQEIAPTTVEQDGWIGDIVGGDLDALSEEELAEAARAWIDRATPGTTETVPTPDGAALDNGPATGTITAVPEAPGEDPPAEAEAEVQISDIEPDIVAEEVTGPPEPPIDSAPSLFRSSGIAPGGPRSLGRDVTMDAAGSALAISPSRIGPMPRWGSVPGFHLPDTADDAPPSPGRIVTWFAG
jgi:hypothetical protein